MESNRETRQTRKFAVVRKIPVAELFSLNNKCLIAICSYLPVDSLSNVASTCSRLFFVARESFALDVANKVLEIPDIRDASTKRSLVQHMRNFGDLLDGIRMTDHIFDKNGREISLNLIITYCSGSLKQLQCNRMTFTPDLCQRARTLFGHLTTLKLYDCTDSKHALAMCRRCEDVKVDCETTRNIAPFLERNQRLQTLSLESTVSWEDLSSLARLQYLEDLNMFVTVGEIEENMASIALSSPLRSIVLRFPSDCGKYKGLCNRLLASPVLNNSLEILDVSNCLLDSQFLANVVRFERLHTLKLRVTVHNLEDLNTLKDVRHLKELDWFTYDKCPYMQRLLERLGSTATLKKLTIWSGEIDGKFIESLSRFQGLTKLELNQCRHQNVTEAELAPLGQLRQLKSIKIDSRELFEWLKYLGCTGTLRRVHCSGFTIKDGSFVALDRFRQLRYLNLLQVNNITWIGLGYVLLSLEKLKKVHVVKGLPNMTMETYERLMRICHRTTCQLNVSSWCNPNTAAIKASSVYDDRYVELIG